MYQDCPEGPILPGQHSIERWLIEEQLAHILMSNHGERKECAAQLLSYPLKNKIPLEYIIVEVMFGQIFRLPNPQYLEIAYGSIMIELCKLQPSTMPQVLAQATELLYERIGVMNVACFDRFVNWFAYHLSNFQFRWSWDDWDDSLSQDPELPKPKFIREVLLKCLRLSYHQRVTDIVPDTFAGFLPEKPNPLFKFGVEGQPGHSASAGVIAAIKNKCSPGELLEQLREIESDSMRVDVFTQSLMFLGHKSFSHSFAAIAKFHPVFKNLADAEETQICVLRSVWDLWKNHHQMLVVLTDKLLKTGVVECSSVANWVFSKDMVVEFSKCYIWEIINITVRKMNKHVSKLSKEASEARRMIEDSESDSSDSENEDGSKRRGRNRPVEKPSEEAVEKLEERLEAAQADQKNLFLIIFQRFIMILSEHLVRCDTDAVDFKSPWYQWTVGRLHQIFMLHHEQVSNEYLWSDLHIKLICYRLRSTVQLWKRCCSLKIWTRIYWMCSTNLSL